MSHTLVAPQIGHVRSTMALGRVALVLASVVAVSVVLIALAASFSGDSLNALAHPEYRLSASFAESPAPLKHVALALDGMGGQQDHSAWLLQQRNQRRHIGLALDRPIPQSDGMDSKGEVFKPLESNAEPPLVRTFAPAEPAADGLSGLVKVGAIGQTKLRNDEPVLDIKRMEGSSDAAEKGADGLVGKAETGAIGQTKLRNVEPVVDIKRIVESNSAPEKGGDGLAGFVPRGNLFRAGITNAEPAVQVHSLAMAREEPHSDGLGDVDSETKLGADVKHQTLVLQPGPKSTMGQSTSINTATAVDDGLAGAARRGGIIAGAAFEGPENLAKFGAGNEEDADGLAGKKGLATNGVLDNEMPPVVVPNMNT